MPKKRKQNILADVLYSKGLDHPKEKINP